MCTQGYVRSLHVCYLLHVGKRFASYAFLREHCLIWFDVLLPAQFFYFLFVCILALHPVVDW